MLDIINQFVFWLSLVNVVVILGIVNNLYQDKLADKVRAKLRKRFGWLRK